MNDVFKQLMEDESFRAVASRAANRLPIGHAGPWTVSLPSVPSKAGEMIPPRTKYTLLGSDLPKERTVDLAPVAYRAVYVKDLMRNIGLSTPGLTYSRITGWSASAGGVLEGSPKAESGVVTEAVTDTTEVIATWLPYTRPALQSAEGTAAWISMVMQLFLALAEDQAILNNNTANFKGLLNVSGIQTQAVGGDTKTDAVRKAITKLRQGIVGAGANAAVGFEPSALLLNPADGEDLETQKDSAGGYVLLPAIAAPWWEPLQAMYWRVPVVETNAMPVGTGLLGAFDVGATLWTYGQADVSISDDHDDFFVKNKVAVRIEVRELVATYFPKAFCTITGL